MKIELDIYEQDLEQLIKGVWNDVTAGEFNEDELIYIKTSAVIFLLFIYVWVTV